MINVNHLCMQCMKERGEAEVCPYCGYQEDNLQTAPYLPIRTWLMDRYVVGKLVATDGEGYTYMGWDNILQSAVLIREYCPASLVDRTEDGMTVAPKTERVVDYSRCLTAFLELHRTLSRMGDLPNLFQTYDVIECNGTGYSISRYVESITLNDFLHRNHETLTFEQTKTLMMPAITTLSSLHASGIVHGGISPDTLYVGKDGKLRFSGFAGSELRFARGALEIGLFDGYAAMEQYGFDSHTGPQTDVYAYAATVFRILTGTVPMDAKSRMANPMDIATPLADRAPAYAVEAITHALDLMPLDRTGTIERFRTDFSAVPKVKEDTFSNADSVQPTPPPRQATPEQPTQQQQQQSQQKSSSKKENSGKGGLYCIIAMLATFLILLTMFVAMDNVFQLGLLNRLFGNEETTSVPSLITASQTTSKSSGQLTQEVENFVGMDLKQCKTSYPKYTFDIQYKVYDDTYKAGTIISQEPAAGTKIPLDSDQATNFTVIVSLGPKQLIVPELTGKTVDEAIDLLWKAGFDRNSITFNVGEDYTYNSIVTKTQPAANTQLDVYGDNNDVMIYVQTPVEYSDPEISESPDRNNEDSSSPDGFSSTENTSSTQ